MSLKAIVFANKRRFERHNNARDFEVDSETGEVLYSNKQQPPNRFEVVAAAYRLGNVATIANLRQEILASFDQSDFPLIYRIIEDGTHCGDRILTSEIPSLRDEIDRIQRVKFSDSVRDFLEKLRALLTAAEAEGNPIVFT